MTKAEKALLQRAKRRAANLEPALRRAYLKALDNLVNSVSPAELERYIKSGEVERLIEKLQAELPKAAAPYERSLLDAVQVATVQMGREIPANLRKLVDGGIRFDWLNPRVIDAVKQLDDRMMKGLADNVRETVRAQVETGLQAGLNPRTVARHLDIRLSPNQAAAIENYRKALESGNAAKALSYQLRDARFDKSVTAGTLTPAKIDKMVQAYSRRMHAFNAETQARTASLDALKVGQRLSMEDAINKGIYDRTILYKRWITAHDDRVRDEHRDMEGEIVRFDATFSNGEMIPGESTYNCRCVANYFEEDKPEVINRERYAAALAKAEKATSPSPVQPPKPAPPTEAYQPARMNPDPLGFDEYERQIRAYQAGEGFPVVTPQAGDELMASIARQQGFDGLPQVLDDLAPYEAAGERVLYRGVATEAQAEQFRSGTMWHGLGYFGNGTYTAYGAVGENAARAYGPAQIRMTLRANARVVEYNDLIARYETMKRQMETAAASGTGAARQMAHDRFEAFMRLYDDQGRLAAALGFDAINIAEREYMIVLNRTAVRVQGAQR